MPQNPLEAIESTTKSIVEQFKPKLLAAISVLPPDRLKEGESENPDLVDNAMSRNVVLPSSDNFEQSGKPFYSIEQDNRARVFYPLKGRVDILREHYQSFLGEDWTFDDTSNSLTFAIKGERDVRDLRPTVSELRRKIEYVLSALNRALMQAKSQLREFANNSITERARLEQVLEENAIQRKGSPTNRDDDDLFGDMRDR